MAASLLEYGWLFKISATVLSIGACLLASKAFHNVFITAAVFLITNILLLALFKMMGVDIPLPGRL
jgi:hypothetical protein